MTADELTAILDKHGKWLRGEEGGERAYLSGANLSGADLSGAYLNRAYLSYANLGGAYLSGAYLNRAYLSYANLGGADLNRANLSYANLGGANLNRANLSYANLGGAYLSGADLGGADLSRANLGGAYLNRANLGGANLSGTCLHPILLSMSRDFCRACPPTKRGGRIVYRTAKSQHVGTTEYKPGHTYTAPVLSWDAATACHPGIYAASLEWMQREYTDVRLVRCYVRDGEWTITDKGAIRCHKMRVLGYVE